MTTVEFVRVSDHATMPTKGSRGAAGYDLRSAEDMTIGPHSRALVSTGLKMTSRSTTMYGRIAPRSGIAWRNGIDVGAGVIDGDYQGVVAVLLFNHSDEPFVIAAGDRIAQIIFEVRAEVEFVEVSDFVEETERGAGGFGSTGR